MKLVGDRNQCTACGRYFNSTAAFDKHRVGDFSPHEKHPSPYGMRRCMTEDEMTGKGMAVSSRGFWVTARNPKWQEAA